MCVCFFSPSASSSFLSAFFFFFSSFFSNILLQMVNEKSREKMRNRKKKESKKDREHRFPLGLSMSSDSERNLRKNNSREERKLTRKFHYRDSKSDRFLIFNLIEKKKVISSSYIFFSSFLLFRCLCLTIITSCHLVGIGNRANGVD